MLDNTYCFLLYEELPEHYQHSLRHQDGIGCDPKADNFYKGSLRSDLDMVNQSDLSDISYVCSYLSELQSGVAGDVTGEQRMPTYSQASGDFLQSTSNREFTESSIHREPITGFPGPSSTHSFGSHTASASSSSIHSDSLQQHNITDSTLLHVMTCLMHNKDCEIYRCPCKKLQHHLSHLYASCTLEYKSPESEARRHSSSMESDSDVPSKKTGMHLKLNNKLHPHYHLSSHSHKIAAVGTLETHRRSKSMSDFNHICEVPQDQVGGTIKPGTPIHTGKMLGEQSIDNPYMGPTREELLQQSAVTPHFKPSPPLLREISLSSDNLPVLCLNSCPLQLNSPPHNRRRGRNIGGDSTRFTRHASSKPVLQPAHEVNNDTESEETSSRSDCPTEYDADNNEISLIPHINVSPSNLPLHSKDHNRSSHIEHADPVTGLPEPSPVLSCASHLHTSPVSSLHTQHDIPPHSKESRIKRAIRVFTKFLERRKIYRPYKINY